MTTAAAQIRSFVERVERLETEIEELNSDKCDVYAEAKGQGYSVPALKAVVARRRKDPTELAELDSLVATYMAALDSGTPNATRVHAHAREAATAVKPDDGRKLVKSFDPGVTADLPTESDQRERAA